MTRGFELLLSSVGVENCSVQIHHEVAEDHGNHGKHRLGGPAVIHIQALEKAALLQILDHVLIVGTGAVGTPDLLQCCLCVIGDYDTDTVDAPVFQILKKGWLFTEGLGKRIRTVDYKIYL